MIPRDLQLIALRPEIPSARVSENMSLDEQFQNRTLRPIAKLQDELLLEVFRNYTKKHKKPADWFTSHGDVFPVGPVKMKPFPPVAPNGKRSFPSKETTKGINQWNHYYVRAIDGEVRLWANGEEVSGGDNISPASGYLCLESDSTTPDVFHFFVV